MLNGKKTKQQACIQVLTGAVKDRVNAGKVLMAQVTMFGAVVIVQNPREVASGSVCKSFTMPCNLGATRKPVSSSCFRLLSLMPEVQNGVERVKPALEELEVVRLCCSLGILPSLNPKDLEMKTTETREFDKDLIFFLRKEIFGADRKTETNDVKVISLFGKQDGVKTELEKSNCWSEEMESGLKCEDQGIYCVARTTDAGEHRLVLFGWLQDRCFLTSRLRETATYVLRFLTCLGSDVMCCLTPEDVQQLERCVESMESNQRAVRGSFSVAFHVERQEVKEAVTCENLSDLKLPRAVASQHVQLLKGSYPAFFAWEVVPEVNWVDRSRGSFDSVKAFAEWVVAESKQRNLRLEFGSSGSEPYHDALLEASGRWPDAELKGVKEEINRSIPGIVQQCIEDQRAQVLQFIDDLFDVDVLHKAAKDEGAFVTLHKLASEIQGDREIWVDVDRKAHVTLTMPLRLKNAMKAIAAEFHKQHARCPETARDSLQKLIQQLTVSDKKLMLGNEPFHRAQVAVWPPQRGQEDESLSTAFRQCLAGPLVEARKAWLDAFDMAFTAAANVWLPRWSKEVQKVSYIDGENKVKLEAFQRFLADLQAQHEEPLMTTIRLSSFFRTLYTDVSQEKRTPATDQLTVFKIKSDGGALRTEMLGVHSLKANASDLKAFTVKDHGMVLITTHPRGTLVERVYFPTERSRRSGSVGKVTCIRSFGGKASLCDFNVQERLVAFEKGGGVELYRFDEMFTSLEIFTCTAKY